MERPGERLRQARERLRLTYRDVAEASQQIAMRLGKAKLRQNADFEDIDFKKQRGFDRSLIAALGTGDWIRRHDNCLITGPTGV